jgi:radical SAM superfamily enzyme with C-terminal helix-hairpin-helix motif
MKALVIDGYIDEPGSLGVPPYIHPGVRAAFGAALDADCEVRYITIDELRQGWPVPKADFVLTMAGSAVPGKYIRAMPASLKEVVALADRSPGVKVLGGPAALEPKAEPYFDVLAKKDAASTLHDLIRGNYSEERWRNNEEWDRWLLKGADCVISHPDHPQPLVAEIETYTGCVRWRSGGCSFCVEPLKGEPRFREPEGIISEVGRLYELGVRNFRLGSQTCIISYKAHLDGTDRPRPNPEAIERLLSGISRMDPDVLHLDNANPAIIAEYPLESREILKSMVRHCTSGNVLAFGLESADPEVMRANNLNATAEETMQAIRIVNEIGRGRGRSGLPELLPGLNFVIGLDGESERTLPSNLVFLRQVLQEGLLLRRINIRQVSCIRRQFESTHRHGEFLRFKASVRDEIDAEMLRRLVPVGTKLVRVFTEMREGKVTFGRQLGTYPLLVGIPYTLDIGRFYDVKVVDWGQRSITAVEYPLHVNHCHITALEALPGVGRKRAMRIFRSLPFHSFDEFVSSLDDEALARSLFDYVALD